MVTLLPVSVSLLLGLYNLTPLLNVSHCAMLSLSKPSLNQHMRCSEVLFSPALRDVEVLIIGNH